MSSDHFKVLQIIGACLLLASIPASVWGYIFYKKQQEGRSSIWLTFCLGAIAVFPILLYRFLWQYFPWLNILEKFKRFENFNLGFENFIVIPLSVIFTFMFVGIIEEVMKQSSVHAVDDRRIRSIDDAIEFSILAALGFAFTENIIYFYNIWIDKGPENLLLPFLFRSLFSTFAHLLFSGMFGYFYGIAHFAKPILQEELRDNRNVLLRWFHRVFRFKTAEFFHEEKMFEGLALAVSLHAVYNVFLEMQWTFLMVPYLVIGYLFLSYLFTMKENRKRYNMLMVGERNHDEEPRRVAKLVTRICRGEECSSWVKPQASDKNKTRPLSG